MLRTEKNSIVFSGIDYRSRDFDRMYRDFSRDCVSSGGRVVSRFDRNGDVELVCVRRLD